MNSDYPERKHESPFADYHPQQQSPFAADPPENARLLPVNISKPSPNSPPVLTERRMMPNHDRRIDVIYQRGTNVPMILILLFLSIFPTIQILASSIRNAFYVAIFLNVCFFGTLAAVLFYRKRTLARSFDRNGATRGDGRVFAWNDFRGTISRWSSSRSMGKSIWRIDLYFIGGQIWVFPSTMKNGKEVLDFVKSLPALNMNPAYPESKHTSPFDDYHPQQQSPFAAETPIYRPERSDKAQFSAFLGTFALIASVPPAVWAYWCLTGREWGGYPDRQRLEGSLCGAASLILLTGAVLLFVRAFKIGKRLKPAKLQYQPIDMHSIPPLKNPIRVKYTKYQTGLLIGLCGFFGLMTLINLKQLFTSQFTTIQDIIYKGIVLHGLILALVGTFIFLTIRAKRRTTRLIDVSGITRGDGRLFAWSEFRGAVTLTANNRYNLKYVYRVELVFADGESAWLIPQRIKNYAEVFAFVDALPQAVLKN